MHPAKSVIFFTVASGAGYGLLVALAVAALGDALPLEPAFALLAFGIALGLIAAGLLASTFHLGHPERAWRALSQWRSSWLSREGLAALVTFLPAGAFALLKLAGASALLVALAALLTAAGAFVTVYCTAMIYASLKPVPAWHSPWTAAAYLMLSLMSGALMLAALLASFAAPAAGTANLAALQLVPIGLLVKLGYWQAMRRRPARSSVSSATGLGSGHIRPLDPPHTQENYLMKEMGFRLARRHAHLLRWNAVALAFVLPFGLLLVAGPAGGALAAWAAVLSATLGLLVERWLFFAEAKHVVTLYYDRV